MDEMTKRLIDSWVEEYAPETKETMAKLIRLAYLSGRLDGVMQAAKVVTQ